jgi:copper chaperone NosL
MTRLIPLLCLLLAACQEEVVQDISPVPLNPQAVGHFCQMELLEHEGPKGQAHLAGLPGAPLFFSQVRDVVAYTRMPEQSHAILAVWVNDMGAEGATWDAPGINNWIDAQDAVYVVGAAITGGMGAPELVPFSDPALARAFAQDNGGVVMTLPEIPDMAVLAPVDMETDPAQADTEFEQRLRGLSRKTGG